MGDGHGNEANFFHVCPFRDGGRFCHRVALCPLLSPALGHGSECRFHGGLCAIVCGKLLPDVVFYLRNLTVVAQVVGHVRGACGKLPVADGAVELFLVGDGQEKEALEKQAKDLNISENVRFLGSRSDVADLMNLFDVFVFPSIYEGLPLVLVEAQAADLPCVVSEAIVSEAIFTDKIKKLSLNDSHEQWVTEVLALLNRNDMRNDNYALICERGFDINDTVMRLEEFYKSIIKK